VPSPLVWKCTDKGSSDVTDTHCKQGLQEEQTNHTFGLWVANQRFTAARVRTPTWAAHTRTIASLKEHFGLKSSLSPRLTSLRTGTARLLHIWCLLDKTIPLLRRFSTSAGARGHQNKRPQSIYPITEQFRSSNGIRAPNESDSPIVNADLCPPSRSRRLTPPMEKRSSGLPFSDQ
jgi:hypothetical protein